jgi:chaperone modulatory protein CbpM
MTVTAIHIERWIARGLVRRAASTEADADALEPIDLARLRLLNELADDLGLDDDTVEAVIALIDQVHTLRTELRLVASAIAEQPPQTRQAIATAMKRLGPF